MDITGASGETMIQILSNLILVNLQRAITIDLKIDKSNLPYTI